MISIFPMWKPRHRDVHNVFVADLSFTHTHLPTGRWLLITNTCHLLPGFLLLCVITQRHALATVSQNSPGGMRHTCPLL